MIVTTGQHSFPFSAVNDGESGPGRLSDRTDGFSFADLLGRVETESGLAFKRDENRRIEIFSESVLNENNGYQVVVGENGNPVTEIKEMTENSSQTVTDAGAPDTEPVSEWDSVRSAENADRNHDSAEEEGEPAVHGGAIAENRDSQPEKAAVQNQNHDTAGKESSKKPDFSKTVTQEQKSSRSEKAAAVAGKGSAEENLKTASAAVEANGKKAVRPERGVAADGQEAAIGKSAVRNHAGETETVRAERIITVSVLRDAQSKSENKNTSPETRKANKNAVGGDAKNVSVGNSGAADADTIASLLSSSVRETGGVEKTVIPNITKADLVRELKEQGSLEILREAKILVKDGQSGEIKLVLRPQELGTVKINLILENKHIVGKIFVDNNIVKEALQTAFGDLKEIFAEQGMELGALDVFVSQESQQENFFPGDGEVDAVPLKMAHAVGAVEKHAEIVTTRFDRSAIDIEV